MNRSRTYLTPNRHEKYMVVDGYNIINAWESLKKFINDDLDFAREKLIHLLMEYGQYEKYDITIVFDAQYTNTEEKKLDGIYNFPKYVIMKSQDSQVKQKICKQLDMTDKGNFTYEKYIEIIEKYKILLMEFYKSYAKQNNKFM